MRSRFRRSPAAPLQHCDGAHCKNGKRHAHRAYSRGGINCRKGLRETGVGFPNRGSGGDAPQQRQNSGEVNRTRDGDALQAHRPNAHPTPSQRRPGTRPSLPNPYRPHALRDQFDQLALALRNSLEQQHTAAVQVLAVAHDQAGRDDHCEGGGMALEKGVAADGAQPPLRSDPSPTILRGNASATGQRSWEQRR